MSRDITMCHPRLQTLANKLVEQGKAKGLIIKIGECFRSVSEQDALYAQGRTTAGSIVTNAKGSSYSSMHQWGVAFDVIRNDGKGAYNDSDGWFTKVGKLGKSLGLEWGGDWTSPVDKPHFQLPDWGSTTTKLKNTYGNVDNFKKTWGTSSSSSSASTSTVTTNFAQTEMRGMIVNADAVNLRSGAGTTYSVRCIVPKNALIAVQYIIYDSMGSGWYKVRYGSSEGYMSIDYVTLSKDINNIKYAINKLVSYKVITSPDYWLLHYNDIDYLQVLIMNMSLKVTHAAKSNTITTFSEALTELKKAKVLNTAAYWEQKHYKVKYLDNLFINVANAIQ